MPIAHLLARQDHVVGANSMGLEVGGYLLAVETVDSFICHSFPRIVENDGGLDRIYGTHQPNDKDRQSMTYT